MNIAGSTKTGKGELPAFEQLVRMHRSGTHLSDAYNTLVYNLLARGEARRCPGSILVTSTQPMEGKTTVAVNLALSLVLAGQRVALVDADLRRPRVAEFFGVNNNGGFSSLLSGDAGAEEILRTVDVPGMEGEKAGSLSLITSGSRDPGAEKLFAGARLAPAVADLEESFDVVIVDSPPVLAVSDALQLAPLVKGVVLVLNTGVVSEEDARNSKVQLEQAGAQILGVVMNHFDERHHGKGLHAHYGYYAGNGATPPEA